MKEYREYQVNVLRVVDGDTIEVVIDLGFGIHHQKKLRFLDFDAPETYRPKTQDEKEAGERVKNWLITQFEKSKGVATIRTYRRKFGKYGRILAKIFIDDRNLIQEMKDKGWEKHNYTK